MEIFVSTTQSQIITCISRRFGGDGAVVTPKDFLDIAGRDAIDQALARLVKKRALVRVSRGIYHLPRTNKNLGIPVPPDADKVVDAISRQTGSPVVPSASATANRMGISTQIPANPVYLTTGRSRSIRVGSKIYRLKRVTTGRLPDTGSVVGRALQAIETAGRSPDPKTLRMIRKSLTPKQRTELLNRARYASSWVADTARTIAKPQSQSSELLRG